MATNISEVQTVNIDSLNNDIKDFPQVHPITEDMHITHEGVSRMVMLDRYSFKDTKKETLAVGDLVILTVKADPLYPARGIGYIKEFIKNSNDKYKGWYKNRYIKFQPVYVKIILIFIRLVLNSCILVCKSLSSLQSIVLYYIV